MGTDITSEEAKELKLFLDEMSGNIPRNPLNEPVAIYIVYGKGWELVYGDGRRRFFTSPKALNLQLLGIAVNQQRGEESTCTESSSTNNNTNQEPPNPDREKARVSQTHVNTKTD
jgi:hypothetical protein